MPDTIETGGAAPTPVSVSAAAAPSGDTVTVQPVRFFKEAGELVGPESPAFAVSRRRAADLRANGLVEYRDPVDETAEIETAAEAAAEGVRVTRRGRKLAGLAAALLLFAGSAQAQVSIPNYANQSGWHVGGVLEILAGGTFRLDTGTKTATATSGAATLNKLSGVVTSEALTTAAGGAYTLTLTNSAVAATDQVFASVDNGTNSTGAPVVAKVHPGAGSLVISVQNAAASAALNGTIKVTFLVIKN